MSVTLDWLRGGGGMGARIRAFDWSATPLGAPETWPQSLRSAVSILLPSKAQIVLFWGPELIAIYNDAYAPVFGQKHPGALGRPARECWSEVWDVIGPLFAGVVSTGEAFWAKEHPFFLHRRGFLEETYYDVSYDPVRVEDGTVGGVFCIVSDQTGRVLGERRLRALREMGTRTADAKSAEEVCREAVAALAAVSADVPFCLLYLFHDAGERAELAGLATVGPENLAAGRSVRINDIPALARARAGAAVEADARAFIRRPSKSAADQLLVLPVSSGTQVVGALVAGVSRFLRLAGDYRDFFDLAAARISAAIANARAYAEERVRAQALAELDRAKTAFFSNDRATRILLADDHADMREYVRRLLGDRYEVVAVSDGAAALRAMGEEVFDLVLSDVMMPHLDGLELLRRLRADDRTREVPVILLSARAGEESRIKGMEVGADDYLVKPFSARELLARVGGHLAMARTRRETRNAVHESERRLRETLDTLPAAIYTTDAAGRLTYFNQAAVEFSGRRPELGTDQWCVNWKLYHADGTPMPHDECPMAVALREGRPIRGAEAIAERPDGTRIWFTPYPTPLRDAQGRIVGGINMLVDITDRKHAVEARARLAAIVQFSDDAIISKDLDGIITSWNRGAERLFGYTAEEAIGRSVTMLFPADRLEEEPRILEQMRRGEPIEHHETVRRRKDGTLVDISLSVSPVRDEDGRIVGVSKIARDITARKMAEAVLREREERRRHDLEHALQSERQVTETLQRHLLPEHLPQIEGISFAARYIPASQEAAVGGDFYDVFTLHDGHLGLVIGDVAGYGAQAASVMGQVRMLLRAYAHEGHPPATVLERLNRLLGPGEMVTVLYLVLDPVTGRMTYANAGHPPPLLVAPDGGTRFLFGCDPPLVGGSRPYQSYSGTVDALWTALLYTDGLIEGGEAPDAALRGLAGAAGEAGAKSLDALADAVVGTLADGTTRRDDMAILAFRRQPVDPMRFRITLPSVPHSLSTVRLSLRRWLEAAGAPEEAIFELVVACGEAATNAVEHAYGPEGGSFEVEAERDSERIVIRIRDKGAWRPRRAGGGRGLELIRQLLDSVDVVRGPGGTTVLLERRLRLPTEV